MEGYLLEGLDRGPEKLTKKESYRPHNTGMPLTKNVNSIASVNANHSTLIKKLSEKSDCTTPAHIALMVGTINTTSHGPCNKIMSSIPVNNVCASDVKLQPQITSSGVAINTSQELFLSLASTRDMEEHATHLPYKHHEGTDVPSAPLPLIQPKPVPLYNTSANMVRTGQRDVLLNSSLFTKNTNLPYSERLASLLHSPLPNSNLDRSTPSQKLRIPQSTPAQMPSGDVTLSEKVQANEISHRSRSPSIVTVSDHANDKTLPVGELADQHVPPCASGRENTLLDTPDPSKVSNHQGHDRWTTLMDSNVEPPQGISLEESCDIINRLTTTATLPSEDSTYNLLSDNHELEYCIPMPHLDPNILDFTAVPEYVPHTGAPGPNHETPAQANDYQWKVPKYLQAALDLVIHHQVFFTSGLPSVIPYFLHTIPTADPDLLITFTQITSDIVAAIKSAPSADEAALAYSLFFWLPHIILPIIPLPEKSEKKLSEEERLRAQGIKLKQTFIVFTSGDPSVLFDQLINPKVEPQFKPTQQTQGPDANPNHPVLTNSQKKLFFKDFHAGRFAKAANNLFNTSHSTQKLCGGQRGLKGKM